MYADANSYRERCRDFKKISHKLTFILDEGYFTLQGNSLENGELRGFSDT